MKDNSMPFGRYPGFWKDEYQHHLLEQIEKALAHLDVAMDTVIRIGGPGELDLDADTRLSFARAVGDIRLAQKSFKNNVADWAVNPSHKEHKP